MAKRAKEFVLVYIHGSQLTDDQEGFLESLGKPYTVRNAQFFNKNNPETKFNEVYNLADDKYVAKAYGEKVVDLSVTPVVEVPVEEVPVKEAPKTTRARKTKAE